VTAELRDGQVLVANGVRCWTLPVVGRRANWRSDIMLPFGEEPSSRSTPGRSSCDSTLRACMLRQPLADSTSAATISAYALEAVDVRRGGRWANEQQQDPIATCCMAVRLPFDVLFPASASVRTPVSGRLAS